ncbi:MAG: carboxypeptidase-like regulatory domain-containing protein [Ignavibacteriota bacterium]
MIRDASGSVVPAASITVTNQATKVSAHAVTNDAGEYTLPELPVGTYTIQVDKPGFRTFSENGAMLNAAQTLRADATLIVGNTGEKVEVTANAIQVQSEDAKQSTTVQNKLVNDLPLEVNGTVRTPFDLAALTPDAKNLGGDYGFSLGGGQVGAYGTTLDGISTNTSRASAKELGGVECSIG